MPRKPAEPIGTRRYAKLRRLILAQAGWRCAACGSSELERLQVDHITPRGRNGAQMDPTNLQVLCATCNQIKGASAMTLDDIRAARGLLPEWTTPDPPPGPAVFDLLPIRGDMTRRG